MKKLLSLLISFAFIFQSQAIGQLGFSPFTLTTTEDKLFGSSTQRVETYHKINNIGSAIKVKGRFEIAAGKVVNIVASTLESLTDVLSIVAGMEVNVLSGYDLESASSAKFDTGTFGLTEDGEEHGNSQTRAVSSKLSGGKGIKIGATGKDEEGKIIEGAGNVKIEGSDLTAGEAGILITANNDIKITTAVEETQNLDKKSEGDFVSGEQEDETITTTGKHRQTKMNSGGNILLVAGGDVESISGEYQTEGSVYMAGGYIINEEGKLEKAKDKEGKERKGSVRLYAAQDYEITDTYHQPT